MLEIICIICIICAILIFFHNQANYEFKINQLGWLERDKIIDVLAEKHPLVLKGVGPVAFWTQQDCLMRTCYSKIPVFKDKGLSDWLMTAKHDTACPWTLDHALLLGEMSGLETWADQWLSPLIQTNPVFSVWYRPTVSCWAGTRGLWLTQARWTCLFVTEGSIQVSIMPNTYKKSLPKEWKGTHVGALTVYDTPFAGDLKFMDIVVRPGHMLIMPAHWFVCWTGIGEQCPMVCSIEYHTPVSRLIKGA